MKYYRKSKDKFNKEYYLIFLKNSMILKVHHNRSDFFILLSKNKTDLCSYTMHLDSIINNHLFYSILFKKNSKFTRKRL